MSRVKIFEDNLAFWGFSFVFVFLSLVHTICKHNKDKTNELISSHHKESIMKFINMSLKKTESQIFIIDEEFHKDDEHTEHTEHTEQEEVEHQQENLEEKNKTKQNLLYKSVINYCVKFNSTILIVGGLAESYLYGVRMFGNLISVLLGYIYAVVLIQPMMFRVSDKINTPFEYFEKRYKNKTYVRIIVCLVSMFYYICFLTLYLWGCSVLFTTLMPTIPFWTSSIMIGLYSLSGTFIGGFSQSTKLNLFQFLIVIFGIIVAVLLTIKEINNENLKKIWNLGRENDRITFFSTSLDLTTRYTILNQVVSLPMPWAAKMGLFLPNFKRYKSIHNKVNSKLVLLSNLPFILAINGIILLSGGIVCYIYYYGCDPMISEALLNKNQIGIHWIHKIISKNIPLLSGLLFSSILYFSIIQHSSGINLCGKTILQEAILPFISLTKLKINLTYARKKYIQNWLLTILSLFSILFSILFQYARNTMLSLFFLFNNSINSPIFGLFLLSAFNPYANHFGAMLAFLLNLAMNMFLAIGSQVYKNFRSQEFKQENLLCRESQFYNNSSSFMDNQLILLNMQISNQTKQIFNNSSATPANYNMGSSYDNFLSYLFSIAPIWYCISSVVFTFVFGSLFSLAYSLIKTGTADADSDYEEERKHFIYYDIRKLIK
jgi:hypothetical protein